VMQKHRSTKTNEVTDDEGNVMTNEVKNGRRQLTAAIETRSSNTRIGNYRPFKSDLLTDIKITHKELKRLQEEDVTLKTCYEMAHLENKGGQTEEIQFTMRNDLLFKCGPETSREGTKLKLVVPEAIRTQVLESTHCHSSMIHLSMGNTLNKTINNFYWPSIRRNVREFVQSCNKCQRAVSKTAMKRANAHTGDMKLYCRKASNRKLEVGNKVLLLVPSNNNRLLLQWRGPFIIRNKVGESDYGVEVDGKIRTYHIDILKRYFDRRSNVNRKNEVKRVDGYRHTYNEDDLSNSEETNWRRKMEDKASMGRRRQSLRREADEYRIANKENFGVRRMI